MYIMPGFITLICLLYLPNIGFCGNLIQQTNADTIKVSQYGAIGDGRTNDTRAILEALNYGIENNKTISFSPNKIYLIDSIMVNGKNSTEPVTKLSINGNNATLKARRPGWGNIFGSNLIDTVCIKQLKIDGNMNGRANGNGLYILRSKFISIKYCEVSHCKYSGILIAWSQYAEISNNKVHNNGDGTYPSDGIVIHSLERGIINNNSTYSINNQSSKFDGDGIHIADSKYNQGEYYNINAEGYIDVVNNICFDNPRRGIKIQRSKIRVKNNFLYENLWGIQVAKNAQLSDITIENNTIFNCQTGIGTDGANQLRISKLQILQNIFLGTFVKAKIQLADSNPNSVIIADNLATESPTGSYSGDIIISKNSAKAVVSAAKSNTLKIINKNQASTQYKVENSEYNNLKRIAKGNYEVQTSDRVLSFTTNCQLSLGTALKMLGKDVVLYNGSTKPITINFNKPYNFLTNFESNSTIKSLILSPNRPIKIYYNKGYLNLFK